MSKQPSPYLALPFQHLSQEYDATVMCNRCGFCETVCPTYVSTGKENYSPRGRNQTLRQILEGKMQPSAAAHDVFSSCLTCHACTNICYAAVPVGKLMGSARELTQKKHFFSGIQKFFLQFLFIHRKVASCFLWAGFLLHRLKISQFLQKLGLLSWISAELNQAQKIKIVLPLRFGAKEKNAREVQNSEQPLSGKKVFYFSGCGVHYLFPDAGDALVSILKYLGAEILAPTHSCCGLISNSNGDPESAKKMARKVMQQIQRENPDFVLASDDSCCGFIKNYPYLFPEDPAAKNLAEKIVNLSELLNRLDWTPNPQGERSYYQPQKVTYHDSCQMGNGHKTFAAPRAIIKKFKNVEFQELEESNWCCGGAGSYCLKHPDLAESILERKLTNIEKTQADIILTQAASCLMHIGHGMANTKNKNRKVEHLAVWLAKKLQLQ